MKPGDILAGDYELLRPLGEGGMGVVWLARERSLAREVALKLMRPSDSATRLQRFEREARALAALDHPGILPVLRTGTDSATGLHFLATRPVLLATEEMRHLCDKVLHCPYPRDSWGDSVDDTPRPLPLSALLDGGKALPEASVLRLARDLASALSAAHAAGILHRDLKPSNILYDVDGHALLVDFGLAKFLEAQTESPDDRAPSRSERGSGAAEAPDSLSLDETGHRKFLGSPAYAAPETFRDGGAATPALDWYSFGAILYEALSGNRPRSLRAPSSYDRAHISRAWDPFVAALLEPDPAKRLSDPAAIRRALDRIARRPANGRRRRRLWLVATLVFLGILGTLGILGHLGFLDGRSPETSRQPPVLQNLAPAPLHGPRLSSIWQGDDRGPLQLLNTYRLPVVDDVIAEAIAAVDPETRRLLQEGDAAWTSKPRDVAAANKAYHTAAVRLRDTVDGRARPSGAPPGGSGGIPPSVAACRAVALARLSWTYVVSASHGASDIPYKEALDAIASLVESDPDRYAPLRSWLLAERAYMECMEDRFAEALGDLQEAGILWAGHVPDDGAYEAQVVILQASMGGMCRKVGDRSAALEMTTRAIVALEGGGGDAEGDSGGGRARPAGAPPGGSGLGLPPSFVDLLAGCHYRRAELLHDLGSRLESLQSYRRALDVWRGQFRRAGEPYRLTYAQVLGRVANACVDLKEYAEAIVAWEEMRETLRPLVESDPEQYGPVDAGIRDNIATAHRDLGDETRAAAEAESKDSANSP